LKVEFSLDAEGNNVKSTAHRIHSASCVVFGIFLASIVSASAQCQTPPPSIPVKAGLSDLTQMSIEDLMNLEVTSGAKKEEPVQRTAAAIFVITSEDIRRSGATTLPDVLRIVPGLDVAQTSANAWTVSSRGFSGVSSDKILVLIDGRTVYSPIFSGVLWDAQDLLLADVDRIEVIRGPGAALWGTNAVNGVINIITKPASKTQGGIVTAAGGNVEGGYGAAQYGGKIPGNGFFRVFAKGFSKVSVPGAPGEGSQGGWNLEHGGFRADWNLNSRDSFTLQGDLFRSNGEGTTNDTTSLTPLVFGSVPGFLASSGGNLLSRWHRTISPHSEVSLQVYYDHNIKNTNFIDTTAKTFDVEFEHHFTLGQRNEIVWGAGYRGIEIKTDGGVAVSFIPPRSAENLLSAFLQDQIELLPRRLQLTLGGRLESEFDAPINFQPDARLLWTPSSRQAVWLAASRALRADSVTDTSIVTFVAPVAGRGGILIVPEGMGNPDIRSEAEVALQAGYRAELTSNVSIDGTAFFNRYTHLRGQDAGMPIFEAGAGTPFLILPETLNNKISGQSHGIEFAGTWKPVSAWKLSGGYTWLSGTFRDDSAGAPPNTTATILSSPHHQFSIRSSIDLPHRLEFDSAVYRVGPLDATAVRGYYRLDARFGWRIGEHAEFAVVGQNLLSPGHVESSTFPGWFEAMSIRRSYYAKMTWHFQLK
jgi:iron complex outermembrane receptor protein